MVHAKNYETASKFVKVMPRNTVASFFLDMVYNTRTKTARVQAPLRWVLYCVMAWFCLYVCAPQGYDDDDNDDDDDVDVAKQMRCMRPVCLRKEHTASRRGLITCALSTGLVVRASVWLTCLHSPSLSCEYVTVMLVFLSVLLWLFLGVLFFTAALYYAQCSYSDTCHFGHLQSFMLLLSSLLLL